MSQLAIRAAIELALDAMPGLAPSSDILSFDGSVVKTTQPHGLITGVNVRITNNTALEGSYTADVLSLDTFRLRDTVLAGSVVKGATTGGKVVPQLTAWENVAFNPIAQIPWQKINFVFARPDEFTMGQEYYREQGFLQVTLYYPPLQGPGAAMSRAELIRKTFPRGSSFSKDGITVHVSRTAEIMSGMPTDEHYVVVVRVPFYADIHLS
jgi:hypothetical protein